MLYSKDIAARSRASLACHPGRRALAALLLSASLACGGDGTAPETTGDIRVQTQTAGFFKDDAYDLLLDGQSLGGIGASDEVTLSDLAPDIYLVDLVDVAPNCEDAPALARVAAGETADVILSVVCRFGEPTEYTLRFEREQLDLDTGEITDCSRALGLDPCASTPGPDLYAVYNSLRTVHAVVAQNQSTGVEIAHLPGVTLDELTEEDVAGATFTTDIVGDSFDAGRVILIRTDTGSTYALGNPVEDDAASTLTFEAVLVAES